MSHEQVHNDAFPGNSPPLFVNSTLKMLPNTFRTYPKINGVVANQRFLLGEAISALQM